MEAVEVEGVELLPATGEREQRGAQGRRVGRVAGLDGDITQNLIVDGKELGTQCLDGGGVLQVPQGGSGALGNERIWVGAGSDERLHSRAVARNELKAVSGQGREHPQFDGSGRHVHALGDECPQLLKAAGCPEGAQSLDGDRGSQVLQCIPGNLAH